MVMPSKVSFRVIHASGQDDAHKASELNTHSPLTKGWLSSRFCLYPQDIVLETTKRSRFRKIQILSHQFSIATRIEFYVGDVPPGTPVSLQSARYTRLGYVELSDNEKTDFKARELKSVHVDAVGLFLKLVIHKNHVNKHNLYNQVGIVAVNVIGDKIHNPLDPDDTGEPQILDEGTVADPALADLFNRPDYISPLDDLAFDMYQDPEIAQVIRKLEKKKQEAVLQERYDYAKKLKQAIQELQKVGEKLGKFEVEKRQAVENEDYDRAQHKKVQMEEYRLQIYKQMELHNLLEISGPRHPQPVNLEPTRLATPPRLVDELSQSAPAVSHTPYDDRPLPTVKNEPIKELSPRVVTPYDDRPIPASKGAPPEPIEDEAEVADDIGGGITDEAEQLNEKDLREASTAIDVFGHALVSKAYSKSWSFREDAMLQLISQLRELPASTSKDDTRAQFRAALFITRKGVRDQVFSVFKSALKLLDFLFTEFIRTHKLAKADIVHGVGFVLPDLLQRTGDTAARTRDEAKQFVIKMSHFTELKHTHCVPHECVKPFKLNISPRLTLSRVEIVEHLYKDHGLNDSGLTVENMMKFLVVALEHTNGQVREAAERVIIMLYKDQRAPVKDYLPPDDDKTRRNTLYRQLFEAFDKIDGKPSKTELKKRKEVEAATKAKEIAALQDQLAQLRDMNAAANKGGDGKANKGKADNKSAKDNKTPRKTTKKAPTIVTEEDDTSTVFNMDSQCIFCAEKSETFTEEGLDIHYWKSCPMLKRCANCKQVVEIAGLTEHLLSECEAKANFAKDPRCSEAIPKAEYDQHVKAKSCNPAEENKNHCPLCHQNFLPAGEEGWKEHLMGPNGCKQNPRRMNAVSKQGAGKSNAAAKGKPSKVTPRR